MNRCDKIIEKFENILEKNAEGETATFKKQSFKVVKDNMGLRVWAYSPGLEKYDEILPKTMSASRKISDAEVKKSLKVSYKKLLNQVSDIVKFPSEKLAQSFLKSNLKGSKDFEIAGPDVNDKYYIMGTEKALSKA